MAGGRRTREGRCGSVVPADGGEERVRRRAALSSDSVYSGVVRVHAEGSGLGAAVKGISAHALRATAAATALGRGAPAGAVRDWLGHASLATTARYYRAAERGESAAVLVSYPKAPQGPG